MVAFHVQRQLSVPLSTAEFLGGLSRRYPERDGMYFLPTQVAEYDRKRNMAAELRQLSFFVTDEASAIQWVIPTAGIYDTNAISDRVLPSILFCDSFAEEDSMGWSDY